MPKSSSGFRIIFLSALLLSILLLVACGDCTAHKDENADGLCDECSESIVTAPTDDPDTSDDEKSEDLVLIEDSEARFKLVLPKKSSSTIEKAADKLVKKLSSMGIELTKAYDETDNLTDTEVLLGVPQNRGEKYLFDFYTLGYDGYLLKVIDGKLLIVGGSDDALVKAFSVFEEEVLKITEKTKELQFASVEGDYEQKVVDDDYAVSSLKINGNDIRDYTIAADSSDTYASATARELQKYLYLNTGYYLRIVELDKSDKSIIIKTNENSYKNDGFALTVDDSSISFECEFPDRIKDKVLSFFTGAIENAQGEVNFTSASDCTENLRVIYYSEFGAVGDGITDDFLEIKACHDYANKWGHTVFADKDKTYYIGKENAGKSISVKTDTDWQGAKFIFDDSDIAPTETALRRAPIFLLESDFRSVDLKEKFSGKELSVGDRNIGFSLGYAFILRVMNENVKNYIRYGINEDTGYVLQEVLLIDAEGNIDPATPVLWDYEVVTDAAAYPIGDRPISVGNAVIDTISNRAPNYYTDYARNIQIRRSHTTVYGVDHSIKAEGETRAPYKGTIHAERCYDVTIKDIKVEHHDNRYDADTGALLGTYELGADSAILIKWINCYQKNFFTEDGISTYKGLFCTDYCRNLYLEDCFLGSFDSHKALDNLQIKNSTFDHINCIGTGEAVFENITIYADGTSGAAIKLRPDYGSTWNGNIRISGLLIKYFDPNIEISLIRCEYNDWNFGYTSYFPREIYVSSLTTAQVIPTNPSSHRLEYEEKVVLKNAKKIHLTTDLELYPKDDISKFKHEGGSANFGVYLGAVKFTVADCPDVPGWILPNTPQFENMQVFINGEQIADWKERYGT